MATMARKAKKLIFGEPDALPRTSLVQENLTVVNVPLTNARNGDFTVPDSSAPGLAEWGINFVDDATGDEPVGLVSEPCNSGAASSILDSCALFAQLPMNYIAGQTVQIRIRARLYNPSAATHSTQTIDAILSPIGTDETPPVDVVTTAAQTLTESFATYTFDCTSTNLTPGQSIRLAVIGNLVQSSGAANAYIEVIAVDILCDTKG